MRLGIRSIVAMSLIAGVSALTSAFPSEETCGFSGVLDLQNAVELEGDMRVTAKVELVNHGETDAFDLSLTLRHSLNPDLPGEIWVGTVPAGQYVVASGEITLAPMDFSRWQDGPPRVVPVNYTDVAGEVQRSCAGLLKAVVLEGQ